MTVTAYELANGAQAKSATRYGDLPLGAVICGDERYNRPGLFNGSRGWDYWNRLAARCLASLRDSALMVS